MYQRIGLKTMTRRLKKVVVHPMPILLIKGTTSLIAPAPSQQQTRLLAAVAVPALWINVEAQDRNSVQ